MSVQPYNAGQELENARPPLAGSGRRLGILVLLICFALPETAVAGTLAGRIVGSNQRPKAFVRIEIGGPREKTVFSGPDGRFRVDLPPGQYTVQIYERTRGTRFTVDVPRQGVVEKRFPVRW